LSVERDIKQTRPFPSQGQEAAVALLLTADVVRRAMGAAVEPHGITVQQYNVLRILRGAGAEGLPTLEIVERMIEQTPGITRLIDRLESKKLVSRQRCPNDRRRVFCRITPAGTALLAKLDAPVRAAADIATRNVNPRQLAQLIQSLDRMREGLNSATQRKEESS
jgi:DNA-binding MarR family transcriptional regulator